MKIRKNGKVINLTESDLRKITESVLTEGDLFATIRIDKFFKKRPYTPRKNEDGSYTLTNKDGEKMIVSFPEGE
jgi:hypothetical protein